MKILWTDEQRWQAVFDMIEADKARGEHPYTDLLSAPGETIARCTNTSGRMSKQQQRDTIAGGGIQFL